MTAQVPVCINILDRILATSHPDTPEDKNVMFNQKNKKECLHTFKTRSRNTIHGDDCKQLFTRGSGRSAQLCYPHLDACEVNGEITITLHYTGLFD